MKNFLIGMWGGFDERKYERDFMPGFYGIEACMFPDRREVQKLKEKSEAGHFRWGAHYPLLMNNSITRDPLFISLDKDERKSAFRDFENEARLVSEYGGTYLLAHFPKPVIISGKFDFTYWRFGSQKEWIYEKDYPTDILKENMYDMFRRLDKISLETGLQLVLENDAISEYLSGSVFLNKLFDEFSGIRACLDIGRLHLQGLVDSTFNGIEFAKKLAPYTYLLHLWNTSPEKNKTGGHLPVSPEQRAEGGFADVRAYLKTIFADCGAIMVLFEHNSELISDIELQECYNWVASIQRDCDRETQ